jgi:hypothetical protein
MRAFDLKQLAACRRGSTTSCRITQRARDRRNFRSRSRSVLFGSGPQVAPVPRRSPRLGVLPFNGQCLIATVRGRQAGRQIYQRKKRPTARARCSLVRVRISSNSARPPSMRGAAHSVHLPISVPSPASNIRDRSSPIRLSRCSLRQPRKRSASLCCGTSGGLSRARRDSPKASAPGEKSRTVSPEQIELGGIW